MTTYITSQGDTVEYIAWKFYGTQASKVVEQVLAANAGLADRGPVLPANVTITLPAIDTKAAAVGVKLWD